MKTDVIFRKYKDGDIIALFPNEPWDLYNMFCTSYMRIGQHGQADFYGVLQQTKPCEEDEYKSLKDELVSIGYDLNIYKRRPKNK